MVVYSTDVGICSADKKEIPKNDAGGKGYKSPKPADEEIYANDEGKAAYRYTFHKLCKKHYLEEYAEVNPEVPLPAI